MTSQSTSATLKVNFSYFIQGSVTVYGLFGRRRGMGGSSGSSGLTGFIGADAGHFVWLLSMLILRREKSDKQRRWPPCQLASIYIYRPRKLDQSWILCSFRPRFALEPRRLQTTEAFPKGRSAALTLTPQHDERKKCGEVDCE